MRLPRTPVVDLGNWVGQQVRACGWVDGIGVTGAGREGFVLRDRTATVPVVVPGVVDGLALEAAVEVVGTVVAGDSGAGSGVAGVEVSAEEVSVLGRVLGELPVDEHAPLAARLDWRFLDLRLPRNLLVFQVQTTAERAMRQFWASEGFLELHSPRLRPDPNPAGHELFTLTYFGQPAYLAKSPQHSKQMAMAAGFERVFEIGPVFRANPYSTPRHDTEFTSVDVELSWIGSHHDVMAFEERWLRHVVAAVADEHGAEIASRFGTKVVVPEIPFPKITFEDARAVLDMERPELAQPPGDLDPAGERALGEHVARRHGHQLVFVTDYPAARRAFYHMRTEDGSDHARDFDLLYSGMEVTTGAQREHRYDRLVAQAQARGIPLDPIRSYLECFRFGCPPHGGFGLGLTRMLMAVLGVDDVREVTFCHRGPDRLRP
ncbi:MAG: aspartate--tRNA(Asn) ligase [Acidimicrobiales bacterium]